MADLTTTVADGDQLFAGSPEGSSGVNAMNDAINESQDITAFLLDKEMVLLDYAQKNTWTAPNSERFPRKTSADIATDSNGYLNKLSTLTNCVFISQFVDNGALVGPMIVPNTVSTSNDQTDGFTSVAAWTVNLTGAGIFQSTGTQLQTGSAGAGTFSGIISTARTVSSSNLVQFSIEKESDVGGGGNTINVELRESVSGTVIAKFELQASGADKWQAYIGSIANGSDLTFSNNDVVRVRVSYVSATIVFIEWLINSTVVFAGFKTVTELAFKFGITGSRAAGTDSMLWDNFSADHATSFTAGTIETATLSSSYLESSNIDKVYVNVQPYGYHATAEYAPTFSASSNDGSNYTDSLAVNDWATITSTLGKLLKLKFNMGGTGNNRYVFKGFGVKWSNA